LRSVRGVVSEAWTSQDDATAAEATRHDAGRWGRWYVAGDATCFLRVLNDQRSPDPVVNPMESRRFNIANMDELSTDSDARYLCYSIAGAFAVDLWESRIEPLRP
jgi:hypothetical protein